MSEQTAMLMEVSTFCNEAGCKKVLILGAKTKVNLTVADIYALGAEGAKLHLQVAVVEPHDASNEHVNFLETVMQNRGGSIQFFDTEQEAKDWLALSTIEDLSSDVTSRNDEFQLPKARESASGA